MNEIIMARRMERGELPGLKEPSERPKHYKLVEKEAVPCSIMEWAALIGDVDGRVVKREEIGDFFVSTIFLGLDHALEPGRGPEIFETCVFVNEDSQVVGRYSTWEQAEAGHAVAAEKVREYYHEK